MSRNKYILFFVCLCISVCVSAQTGMSSPYSRYAFGILHDNAPVAYRAMGGVSIGMRSNRAINPNQPASYTACDSLTFMFDAAARINYTRYEDATGVRNKADGNLDYVSLQFPIWKRHLAFSAGLLPYSSCGYSLVLNDVIQSSSYSYTTTYNGEGGISEVYAGLSGNILNWLAVGVNVYYMFGDIENARSLDFTSSAINNMIRGSYISISTVRLRYGVQLFHQFENHSFTIGGILEHAMPAKGTYMELSNTYSDTISAYKEGMHLPWIYGIGGSYTWKSRLTIGIDFERQLWGRTTFMANEPAYEVKLSNSNRLALGIEYRHNPYGTNYAQRMWWRVGASYRDSYISVMPMRDWRVSMGLGFPLRNAGTSFNVAIEYVRRGSKNTLIENGLQVTINAAIREMWFFKRKI